ncbi:hypothetical protein C6988_00930 [Nitrosopumilus sp. b1]|uniref:PIG-L deacetylase family protein n=1 Tax=Nitrosopumilus sp. b1 TaxID=2109907 RepID=UPI0015F6B65B|nr:PIG-L family deacetylase [Nitrosopumilus sp. b1]KAF6244005.1 hypothetical protein C6988_00930 [Nitrosopumilus sp. b1]
MNILVLAAHPDDEVLGMGGTIKKLSRNNQVHLCTLTDGSSAQYSDKKMIHERKKNCMMSGKILGIRDYYFLDFPDMKLDKIPILEINRSVEKIIGKFKPKIVYTISNSDYNRDHQIVYESSLITTRPYSSSVKKLLAYEIPGIQRKKFISTVYENIEKELKYKIRAFNCYKSEVRQFPHPRSVKAIENLSIQRGVESCLRNAEAFELIRSINA